MRLCSSCPPVALSADCPAPRGPGEASGVGPALAPRGPGPRGLPVWGRQRPDEVGSRDCVPGTATCPGGAF